MQNIRQSILEESKSFIEKNKNKLLIAAALTGVAGLIGARLLLRHGSLFMNSNE